MAAWPRVWWLWATVMRLATAAIRMRMPRMGQMVKVVVVTMVTIINNKHMQQRVKCVAMCSRCSIWDKPQHIATSWNMTELAWISKGSTWEWELRHVLQFEKNATAQALVVPAKEQKTGAWSDIWQHCQDYHVDTTWGSIPPIRMHCSCLRRSQNTSWCCQEDSHESSTPKKKRESNP